MKTDNNNTGKLPVVFICYISIPGQATKFNGSNVKIRLSRALGNQMIGRF